MEQEKNQGARGKVKKKQEARKNEKGARSKGARGTKIERSREQGGI